MSLQVILQAADCTVRTPPVQAWLKTGSVAKIKHASRNSIQKIFQMHTKIMKADVQQITDCSNTVLHISSVACHYFEQINCNDLS